MNDKFSDSLDRLLSEGRMGYAIKSLLSKCRSALATHPDLARVDAALERVDDTYVRMRQYMIEGNADPDRERIYGEMKQRVKELARRYLFIVNEDRLDPFFAEYRLNKVRGGNVTAMAGELEKLDFRISMACETETDPEPFIARREETVDAIFRRVWSLPPWARHERETVRGLFQTGDFELSAQLISALLLGLLKFNDPGKLLLLLHAYETAPNDRIAARALTAVVLVLGRWGDSALSTPEVREAIQNLEDSLLTYSRVRDIVMTFIRTRDTDRVSREVSDAFKATMKKMTPEMLERLSREGLTVDSGETGMNPEWEKLLQNNKEIEDRMKAINEMQLEGMDVMMQTFSRLKSFPFFNTLSHWFVPFSDNVTAVAPLFRTFNPEGFRLMADATEMCASDRFSFALGILQMPEDRRNLLAMHLGGQLEALKDALADRENVGRRPEFAYEALVYARDLYRFAKLYPRKKDFHDPFGEPIDFLKVPLLRTLLEGDDIILTSADFYFRHGYYAQALALYEGAEASVDLAGDADTTRSLYEKTGFCRQMEGDLAGALRDYERADLFSTDMNPASTWLLKKLAFCNKALGNYTRAAEYYGRLLERQPDDLKTEFQLGSVLLRAGEFDRGRKLISKVNYLDPGHKMAARISTRMKAHEAFLDGRLSEALSLYEEARGDQDMTSYRRDLAAELTTLDPEADVTSLQILLDFGD